MGKGISKNSPGQKQQLMNKQHKPININLVFVGSSFVGKTWIRKIMLNEPPPPQYRTTISVDHDFLHHTFDNLLFQDEHEVIYDSVKAYIEITDTSGHRDFKENIKFSIKKADGVVFVIGNNDQYSLRRVREELLPLARAEAPKGVKIMLACNKTDLKRQFDEKELQSLKQLQEMTYEQICTKNQINVKKSILSFAKKILLEKVEVVDLRDLYMNMLLTINPDFDDDLLMEIIELLGLL